ncbi:MAG: carbohydrate ABC transporter permease [Anaerolineae bacterium]|jgi:multiple sugar transport system permease protein
MTTQARATQWRAFTQSLRDWLSKHEEPISGYLFLMPTLLSIFVFVVFPVLFSFYLSFHDWDYLSDTRPFLGLENYVRMFQTERFWTTLKNTARYGFSIVPLNLVVALGLALLVNNRVRGINLFRTAYFSPVVTSSVAVAMIWGWIFDPGFGLLNYLLRLVGISPILWLGDPKWAVPSLVIMAVWNGVGYNMMIFLAGLQGVPQEYYDAATVDGANSLKQFWHVTLPLLSPTTFFVVITGMIGALQVFDQIFILTKGGPAGSTRTIVYYLWEHGFEYWDMGYASAVAYVLFAVIFALTQINWRVGSRFVHYQ